MTGVSWDAIRTFKDSNLVTKGLIAEQFIAQQLAYLENGLEEPQLFYWLRDKKTENAEVDFVISFKEQITPLEVKSGQSGKLKSLVQFVEKNKTTEAFRFDLKERTTNNSNPVIEKVVHKSNLDQDKKIKFVLNNWHVGLVENLKLD